MTSSEYLVRIDIDPADAELALLKEFKTREAARAEELSSAGNLVRLWRVPGRWANIGIWRANDEGDLHRLLDSLPLRPYMTISVQRLDPHPSDPAGEVRE